MKLIRRLFMPALMAAVLMPLGVTASDSYMPGYMAFEGQLKGSDPPAWQMIASVSTKTEAEINSRGNQLLSSLVSFVKKRGDAASGVLVTIRSEETSFGLWSKVMSTILEEASSRTSSGAIEKLKITVTLTDPVSKAEKTLQFQKQ